MRDERLTTRPASRVPRPVWQALLLAGLSLALIAGCWDSPFSHYDDTAHILENPSLGADVADLLKPTVASTYFPITMLSYKLDRALFAGWMPGLLGSWAPGVRFMTLLYHVAAALILWRALLRLRLSGGTALFIAAVFAVHPLACETVCWTSERKNALAGMLSFAALWVWLAGDVRSALGAAPQTRRWWRIPAALALYVLALASKPSALGLLPVLLCYELFGGAAGLDRAGPLCWRPSRAWLAILGRLTPLGLVSWLAIVVNIKGHDVTIIPPPGGSVFTALLTDLEILVRYVFNLVLPFRLSAVYFVDPVRSVLDLRVPLYGAAFLGLIAASVCLAGNRRRAVFGWLWFVGALGPNLNIIAIPHLMQDRYLYLGTPGLLLVLVEVLAGLQRRATARGWNEPRTAYALALSARTYVAVLLILALMRGAVWSNMLAVFQDAVDKQPQAVFARYGLGNAYAQIWEDTRTKPKADPAKVELLRRRWLQEWKIGVDSCPDAWRFSCYLVMALNVGEKAYKDDGDLTTAEHYWAIASERPREANDNGNVRAIALCYMTALRIEQGRLEEAYALAQRAVPACAEPPSFFVRARAALKLAGLRRKQGDEEEARRLLKAARADLEIIPPQAGNYKLARELLQDPAFKE